ncbi:MAG: hypothetical protein V6Z89_03725 [Desulfobacter sp.]
MDCKEFHHWLSNRNIHECVLPPEVTRHMALCHECERLFRKDNTLEQALVKAFAWEDLPRGLSDRVDLVLDHEDKTIFPLRLKRSARIILASASVVTALVMIALAVPAFFSSPSPEFKNLPQISRQAVANHLLDNRPMDFNARDVDHALALMAGELGFEVSLPDLSLLDSILRGGKLCALGNCRAAYFVVEKQGKTGSLFIMSAGHLAFNMPDSSRFTTRMDGCDIQVWQDKGQVYAMVF